MVLTADEKVTILREALLDAATKMRSVAMDCYHPGMFATLDAACGRAWNALHATESQ